VRKTLEKYSLLVASSGLIKGGNDHVTMRMDGLWY